MSEAFDAARAALRRAMVGSDPPLTLERCAALLGVERENLWRWLTGRTQPSLDAAFRMQEVLGIYAGLWARLERPPDK